MLYDPLRVRLATERGKVQLDFAGIEALVGPLPPSARRHREWWANTRSHSQARAWLDAGYRVSLVDVLREKVVFDPAGRPASAPTRTTAVSAEEPGEVAPGSSEEQKRAEAAMLAALSAEIGVPLVPTTIRLSSGNRIAVDGVSDDPPVLCEAWAHQGSPKAAQQAKVAKDLLKLTFLASLAAKPPRLVLLFSDRAACAPFRGKSWVADVIRAHDVEIRVVELPDELREAVRAAQKRQYR